jgi:acetolactate synthase-1/2/3 large subunit
MTKLWKRSHKRTGGRLVVDALLAHGVDTVFCVPGESYLPVLDALYDAQDDITVVTCRHEHGAADMAEAYGKLTGRPGSAWSPAAPAPATPASASIPRSRTRRRW